MGGFWGVLHQNKIMLAINPTELSQKIIDNAHNPLFAQKATNDFNLAMEQSQQAVTLTIIYMGLVIVGGITILIGMFLKQRVKSSGQ